MKVHEYQAKELFSEYHIPVGKQILCYNADQAKQAYIDLGAERVVVKAQVHIGGRGKAGGVKLATTADEAYTHAQNIIGMDIKGLTVDRVIVCPATNIQSEYYLSILIDRKLKQPIFMLSRKGGMDIEQVARETPEDIVKIPVNPLLGVTDAKAREVAFALFDDYALVKQAVPVVKQLYRLFKEKDASLLEINPLVTTAEGTIEALDAKMTFDDNALFRHKELEQYRELTADEQKELQAKQAGFSYVNLGGDIGCMVNGAGLAMATMDMIKLYGGEPANFLDIGGSSNPEKIVQAMQLLMADEHVRCVLINIFGGITRCDDVARGLIEAFRIMGTTPPMVIRLTGTNQEEGRALLAGTPCVVATTMADAGHKVVELCEQLKQA